MGGPINYRVSTRAPLGFWDDCPLTTAPDLAYNSHGWMCRRCVRPRHIPRLGVSGPTALAHYNKKPARLSTAIRLLSAGGFFSCPRQTDATRTTPGNYAPRSAPRRDGRPAPFPSALSATVNHIVSRQRASAPTGPPPWHGTTPGASFREGGRGAPAPLALRGIPSTPGAAGPRLAHGTPLTLPAHSTARGQRAWRLAVSPGTPAPDVRNPLY